MNMEEVQSSAIVAIGYDELRRVMRVQFRRGWSYDVPNMSREEFEQFRSQPSLGSTFHQHYRARAKPVKA